MFFFSFLVFDFVLSKNICFLTHPFCFSQFVAFFDRSFRIYYFLRNILSPFPNLSFFTKSVLQSTVHKYVF